MNCILVIPKPLTITTLFISPLCGVNAFGTSTNAAINARAGWQIISAHPAGLIAVKHALNVPVTLYWCCIGNLDDVCNESPSPNFHLNDTASGEELFVNVVGVFSTGGSGATVNAATGLSKTFIVNVVVSV